MKRLTTIARLLGGLAALTLVGACNALATETDEGAGGNDDPAGNGGSSVATGGAGGSSSGAGAGSAVFVPDAPSCEGLDTTCADESCCTSITVPGGVFPMGCEDDTAEGCNSASRPEHDVTMDAFALDKYMVTVGRFRKYYESGFMPEVGDGELPDKPGSGWRSEYFDGLGAPELSCSGFSDPSWTDEPGDNEDQPINCVPWEHAVAFCIWDGGWLQTSAQWEYAATGGEQNRLYPWGPQEPDEERLGYDFQAAGAKDPFAEHGVGTHPTNAGRWGHMDLLPFAEYTYDCYDDDFYRSPEASEPNPLDQPAQGHCAPDFTSEPTVTVRGMVFNSVYLSPQRTGNAAQSSHASYGFRCARMPE